MGMNLAFKTSIFMICLTLGSGLMLQVMDFGEHEHLVDIVESRDEGHDEFVGEGLGGNVSLPDTSSATANLKDLLLDATFFGKVVNLLGTVGTVLFGFPVLVYDIMLAFVPSGNVAEAEAYIDFANFIMTSLGTMVLLSYGLAVFFMFTNRKMNE